MIKPTKIMMAGLCIVGLAAITSTSEARWFGFDNGNMEGAFQKMTGTYNEGPMEYTYGDASYKIDNSWGFALKAVRTSNGKGKGAYYKSYKTFNGGWCLTRSYTGGWDRDRAWSAFWTWDGDRTDGLEKDIIEYTPSNCQWNMYYDHTPLTGTKTNNPRWWRDGWARSSCSWSKKTTGATFKISQHASKQKWVNLGATRNTWVHIRFQNRPWSFNNNAWGKWKRFGNMNVDICEHN